MSSGSYDYFFGQVRDMADRIRGQQSDPRRAAFAKLLRLVSAALHDIEWVDSCDYGPGDEHEAIDKVFAFLKASPMMAIKAAAYDELTGKLKEYLSLGQTAQESFLRGDNGQK